MTSRDEANVLVDQIIVGMVCCRYLNIIVQNFKFSRAFFTLTATLRNLCLKSCGMPADPEWWEAFYLA